MRALGDQVVAERLRVLRSVQILAQADTHVVALCILAADDQAETHRVPSSASGEGGIGAVGVKRRSGKGRHS